MIGLTIMEISHSEMKAAIEYYLNSSLFFTKHKAKVTDVTLRSNGRFTIRFEGDADPEFAEPKKIATDDAQVAAAGSSGGD